MDIEQPPTPPPLPNTQNVRTWAMLCHLSSLAGFLVPFGNLLAPLLIWMFKKNDDPLINDQGKESLNFQVTMLISLVIASILIFFLIGLILIPLLILYNLVLVIMASVEVYHGKAFHYPLTIRFLR